MAGETTSTPAAPAPVAQPTGQSTSQPTPQHHSARQPRDEGRRFAGPPGQQPPAERQPQPQAAPAKRRFTFVEEGKEVVEELDDGEIEQRIRAERNRRYLDKAATQKLQRASEMAKQLKTAEQVAEALVKRDPAALKGYFAQNKLDPKEALADLLEAFIAEDELTPEQKELAAAKAQLAAMEEEKRRGKQEAEVHAFQKRMDEIRPEVQKVWTHALEQEGLPKTEAMLETAAGIFLTALEAGQRLSPEQVAELTRWEMVENQKGLVESMEPPNLFKHFPGALNRLDEGLSPEEFEQRFPSLAKRYWAHLAAMVRGNARRGSQPQAAAPAHQAPTVEQGGGVLDPYLAAKLRGR